MGKRWNRMMQKRHDRHCKEHGHTWDATYCVCLHCGHTEHKWNGCRCISCGKSRPDNHIWEDGKCAICGETEMVHCPACKGEGSKMEPKFEDNPYISQSGCGGANQIGYEVVWVCSHCAGAGRVPSASSTQGKRPKCQIHSENAKLE